jgi:hypothetical protein
MTAQAMRCISGRLRGKAKPRYKVAISTTAGALATYHSPTNVNKAEESAARERKRAEGLLYSILPRSVAEELGASGNSRPVRVESATILFSDFVHFSRSTKGIDPVSVIGILPGRVLLEFRPDRAKTQR